jgi:hypothetical protein
MITKYLSYLISPYGVALGMLIVGGRDGDYRLMAWSGILVFACIAHEGLRLWRKEEDEKDKAWREKQKNDKV